MNGPREIIEIIVKLKLELVGLRDAEQLIPSQISGGMRKRVGLARAIALDPEVIFYDEPGAGLDPIMLAAIDELILGLGKKLIERFTFLQAVTKFDRFCDQGRI